MPALIMAEVTPERVRQVRAVPVLNNRRFTPRNYYDVFLLGT